MLKIDLFLTGYAGLAGILLKKYLLEQQLPSEKGESNLKMPADQQFSIKSGG